MGGSLGKGLTKTWKAINPVYQAHKLAGKAGIHTPIYLMGEKGYGFGKAIELSGDPFQRMVRGKVRDWAKGAGLAKSAARSNAGQFSPMTKGVQSNSDMFAQQNQMLQNMQSGNQQKLEALRSQSPSYPSLAQSKVGGINASADIPSTFKPAQMQQIPQSNTFQMPNMSNIKFGGY